MAVHLLLGAAVIVAMHTFSGNAYAVSAYTVRDGTTNIHSRPGSHYSVIARRRAGGYVNVVGCLSDFSWCAAAVDERRGWVSGRRLEFMHAGQRVPLSTFYTFFNVPIIGKRVESTSGQRQIQCEVCP